MATASRRRVTNGFTYDTSPVVSAIRPTAAPSPAPAASSSKGRISTPSPSVTFGARRRHDPLQHRHAARRRRARARRRNVNVAVTNPVGTYTITNGFTYIDNDDAARDFFVSTQPLRALELRIRDQPRIGVQSVQRRMETAAASTTGERACPTSDATPPTARCSRSPTSRRR